MRLSEALARMRLAPTVEAADVAEALRLMRVRPDTSRCSVLAHQPALHHSVPEMMLRQTAGPRVFTGG